MPTIDQKSARIATKAVLDELENGAFPQKGDALALIQSIPLLDIGEVVGSGTEISRRNKKTGCFVQPVLASPYRLNRVPKCPLPL